MFLFNDGSPISFNDALPEQVDVVIVGGGVIGVSTAWFLSKQKLSVLICDKGRVAGEQSSRNWGWIRVTDRDPAEVPIAIDSSRYWQEIAGELKEDIGFERRGLMMLAENDKEMAGYEDWIKCAREHDFDSQLLLPNDIARHIDINPDAWRGGVYSPLDARAEPFKAVPAMARELRARGVHIRENCAVRGVELEAGKISGVVTEAGSVKTPMLLCAAGAWSSMLLNSLGIALPQLAVRGTVARTVEAPEVFGGEIGLKDIYVRRRQDGGFTVASGFTEHTIGLNSFQHFFKFLPSIGATGDIGVRLGRDVTQSPLFSRDWKLHETSPFEQHRVLNPVPSGRDLKRMRRNLKKRLPALGDVAFAETWAGMIDVTPDVVPVMDSIEKIPGLFLATGFSGHGFGIGPGAGHVMAQMMTGQPPRHDLKRFRFSRFSDGSKIQQGPAV